MAQEQDRESQLIDLVERLEDRVSELERQIEELKEQQPEVATDSVATPPQELTERVEALEGRAEEARLPNTFRSYWDNGLRLETRDERIKLKLGTLLQVDAGWLDADRDLELSNGTLEDGAALRRARLVLSGSISNDLYFKLGYDFAGGDADFLDNLIGIRGIPVVGSIQAGFFKEPFGMERLTSTGNSIFTEVAQPSAVFTPNRNTGIQLHNTAFNDRMTWALGTFRESNSYGNGGTDGDYSISGRVTGLPWYAQDGQRYLHLGAGFTHRNLDDQLRYRNGPETRLAGVNYLDTGAIRADQVNVYNAELMLQVERYWLMGEYFASETDSPGDDRSFDGFYLASGLFLTPDHRGYNRTRGVPGGVKPNTNFSLGRNGDERGWGAWEVAARYSELDLDDGLLIRGGTQNNWTAALNWYLNPNTRASLSYLRSNVMRDLYEGNSEAIQLRLQFAL